MRRIVLLGHPVRHSLSAHFQNAAIRAAQIDAEYVAVDVVPGKLRAVVEELRLVDAAGNVTVPHKVAMLEMCHTVSDVARTAGAVNTFWTRDGETVGDNTDVAGFARAAETLLQRNPASELVILLGTGGAAAAVLAAVSEWPDSSVIMIGRNPLRAAQLAARFPIVSGIYNAVTSQGALSACSGATLLVNATSVGMAGADSPFDPRLLPRSCAVLDLVYSARSTTLVQQALAAGLAASDGREMLLEQGALSFMQWFGVAPDKKVMRSALSAALLEV